MVGFALVGRLKPAIAQSIWVDGLNMRLNSSCTSFECIVDILVATNTSFMDAMIIPEEG